MIEVPIKRRANIIEKESTTTNGDQPLMLFGDDYVAKELTNFSNQ